MKTIIFIILISFCFCDIKELKVLSSVRFSEDEGVTYLNTQKYTMGDTIYIQFNCINGNMNTKIYYEFSNTIPTDPTYCPYRSMGPSTNAQTSSPTSYTYKYYYNIVKKEKFKYLVMRYIEFDGDAIEIEHNSMSLTAFIFMIIGISIAGIIIIVGLIILIIYMRNLMIERRYQRNYEYEKKKEEVEEDNGATPDTPLA
jgi:hypothetical protein